VEYSISTQEGIIAHIWTSLTSGNWLKIEFEETADLEILQKDQSCM
jgi:hypothetical protein